MARRIWNCLDLQSEIGITNRQLPHWDQNGAITFVTFRLADSMPKSAIIRWKREESEWIHKHSNTHFTPESFLNSFDISLEKKKLFRKFSRQQWQQKLDNCHGSCALRNPAHAMVVANSLLHFNGERYDLERFVVMPNHVHLLVQMRPGFELRKQCSSWLRYSATTINKKMKTSGEFWQSEPFDHIVRNNEQLDHLKTYIASNPSNACLKEGEYFFWKCDE